MTRPQILLLEDIHSGAAQRFRQEGFRVVQHHGGFDARTLAERLRGVSVLGIRSRTGVSEGVLRPAGSLVAIGVFCIGTNHIDLDACAERGIAVFNAPHSNTRSVAELAMGQIIMLARGTFGKSAKLHRGIWEKSAAGSHEVRGTTLGIVGYGAIGSQLSVLAELLGMTVCFFDLIEKMPLGNARRCRSMAELLAASDVVSLHVDGRARNRNLFGEREFRMMKDGSRFLNLSRGHVVDIPALVRYLRKGKIGGAAIDVFPEEPADAHERFRSPLRGLSNVILTPHVGGSTEEAQRNIAEFVPARIMDYLGTGSSMWSVNFPNLQLPEITRAHRLIHVHRNVPGILAQINSLLARHRINIEGQYLKTNERIGYVITDVRTRYDRRLMADLAAIPQTIRVRALS